MAKWPSYIKTRFPLIGLSQIDTNLWRFVSLDFAGGGTTPFNPSAIGPQYASKAEALADLERYASGNFGYATAQAPPTLEITNISQSDNYTELHFVYGTEDKEFSKFLQNNLDMLIDFVEKMHTGFVATQKKLNN